MKGRPAGRAVAVGIGRPGGGPARPGPSALPGDSPAVFLSCSPGRQHHLGRLRPGSSAFWLVLLPAYVCWNRPGFLRCQLHQSGQCSTFQPAQAIVASPEIVMLWHLKGKEPSQITPIAGKVLWAWNTVYPARSGAQNQSVFFFLGERFSGIFRSKSNRVYFSNDQDLGLESVLEGLPWQSSG